MLGILLGLLVLLCPTLTAAQTVGSIADLDGTVEIRRDGVWSSAVIGEALLATDELRTGSPGRVRAVFQESSVLVLGNDTHVVIDEYAAAPQGQARSRLRLLRGKLRALVTDLFARPGGVYEVETHTAVVGVRGTEFLIVDDPVADVTQVVGINDRTEVHSVLDRVGNGVFVSERELSVVERGKMPTAPRRLDEFMFRQYLEGLQFIGYGQSESLTVKHPLITGDLVPPPDRAEAFAPARLPGGPQVVVVEHPAAPGEPGPGVGTVTDPSHQTPNQQPLRPGVLNQANLGINF